MTPYSSGPEEHTVDQPPCLECHPCDGRRRVSALLLTSLFEGTPGPYTGHFGTPFHDLFPLPSSYPLHCEDSYLGTTVSFTTHGANVSRNPSIPWVGGRTPVSLSIWSGRCPVGCRRTFVCPLSQERLWTRSCDRNRKETLSFVGGSLLQLDEPFSPTSTFPLSSQWGSEG